MKRDKQKELLIEQLKKAPIVEIACQKSGIARSSFYRWKKEDPEFARGADESLAEGLLLMNDLAESQLLSAIRDKNLSATIFWLKHRNKSYSTKVEVNANIQQITEKLTPEQERIVAEALRLASLPDPESGSQNHGENA